MSVVNDVLKNLNERHAKELSVQSMPYMYEETPAPQYWLWGQLLVILLLSVYMGVQLWLDRDQKYLALTLPAELFFVPKPSETSSSQAAMTDTGQVKKENDERASIHTQPNSSESQSDRPASLVPKVATKTVQTEHIEEAVAAVKKGDDQAAKTLIAKTPKVIQDELKLHMMVKEQPQSVFPYIQRNFPNFSQHTPLLALAAQGEQRSGAHKNAVSLYQQLVRMQPKQAKWRAGLAISLEAAGDTTNAARMYQLALTMNNLPKPLATFSRQRLQSLVN